MFGLNSVKILAIETSCDETAAAVLEVGNDEIKTLSSVVKSQIKLHAKMGGVVPEVAARAHVKNILPVTKKALTDSKINLADIDYIAVTQGPGLIPSLIVGVEFAKALSLATNKPIIPVNHMLGHLYSPLKDNLQKNIFPMISLIVSGGHTMLVLMKNIKDYKVLGETVDDAAGEAFDKVAKLLKLPYPGGPEVSKLALKGNPDFIFPRPMINNKNYNFSFSGLKTAVLYHEQSLKPKSYNLKAKQNICKAFQDAAVDVLVTKTMRAVKEFGAKSISLSGGVAANQALRSELNLQSKILNLKFFVPALGLCTDNAEMIGLAAAFMLKNGYKPKSYKTIKADSNFSL
jgi:N6-L-threonylcarbamoyladenine synthase